MKIYIKKIIASCMVCLMLCTMISVPADAQAENMWQERAEENGVTVTTSDRLLSALEDAEPLIIISGVITVGEEADESGKMLPLEIPGGVTLRGADDEAELYFRCPLQITGDDVTIQDLKLRFESSDALVSVPHREIFLAGHSLVLDNVDTYLDGSDGALGGLGGTEEELLPSVYAGGFEGTTVSDSAVLTIQNANENTMFEAVYMGHDSGTDSKEAYTGKATIYIGPKTIVRNGIYVNQNASAEIFVTGSQYSNLTSPAFYGNANTTLQVAQIAVNRATIDGIGSIVLNDSAYLQLSSGTLGNVTVQGGACLDLSLMKDVTMTGDFNGGVYDTAGQTDTRGILVLNKEGSLSVAGDVTGTTLLHTDNKNFPGDYIDGKSYVTANGTSSATGFVLPDSKYDYYEMDYASGAWTVFFAYSYEIPLVESIEILSAPQIVDVSKIVGNSLSPAEDAPYCSIVWKDENGVAYTADEVTENQFYARDMVIAMRKDYWEGTDADDVTDWGIPVRFVKHNDMPGYYYFYMESGQTVEQGTYIYLFCSEYFDNLGDVADVKEQLAGKVKATLNVTFSDSASSDNKPTVSGNDPNGEPDDVPQNPEHEHDSGAEQIIPALPGKDGSVKTVCTACGEVLVSTVVCAPQSVILSKTKYTYNGKLCKPKVTVKDRRGGVIDGQYYTVTYSKNKNVGSATVVVTLKGQYSGILKKNFTISPKKTAISKITSKKKSFVVKWKKVSPQISGYQIQYSTSQKFTKKTTKSLWIKNNKTTKKTVKKPKAGKKYYVRIRTYKTVKSGGKTQKVYSAWSKIKTAR